MVGRLGSGVQQAERAAGDGQRDAENDEALEVVTGQLRTPPTPKVKRLLAAVLATAVTSNAIRFASCAPAHPCSATNSST